MTRNCAIPGIKSVRQWGRDMEFNEMELNEYVVQRTLNNNVLIVMSPLGREEILVGKGLGFGTKPGFVLEPDNPRIEKRFALVDVENRAKFHKLYSVVRPEVIGVAEEIIAAASKTLGMALHEHIHVALPDHIGFAVTRLQGGLEIANPFLEEIRTLYPAIWDQAAAAAKLIEKRLGVRIPDCEVGFLTLHLHSATHHGGLSATIRTTDAVKAAVDELERITGFTLSRGSLDYARLVSHLRFAIQRAIKGEYIINPLGAAVRDRLPHSYGYAERIAHTVTQCLSIRIPVDEVSYLAMHVARLIGERDGGVLPSPERNSRI